ncbi:MAG: polyamine aminopropyltransferase [Fibrobacterota bacterium]
MKKTDILQFDTVGRSGRNVLLLSVFVVATCGIVYELLISTISSYFTGSSITQFSLTIGLFLFFMGCGSYFSRYVASRSLLDTFIAIEIGIGFIGGMAAILLHAVFSYTQAYLLLSSVIIALIAGLIGLEIPLVMRVVQRTTSVEKAIAQVFSFDYVGALIASLAFPFILLPHLGIMRTSIVTGCANLLIAAFTNIAFRNYIAKYRAFNAVIVILFITFIIMFVNASKITRVFEEELYEDQIVFTKQTSYQRLVLTKWRDDLRLFIDGNLQFAARDEYRYHEVLVHIPMFAAANNATVLMLGGGDGLGLREILKYSTVKNVDLVDIDPEMVKIGKTNPYLKMLNNAAFYDKRVKVFNNDAFMYIQNSAEMYDVVIVDLPDPNDLGISKLYTKEFYEIVKKRMRQNAVIITQATSPYFSRESFWCINNTIKDVFGQSLPLHVNVPSFGEWGFCMSMHQFQNNGITASLLDTVSVISHIQTRLDSNAVTLKTRFLNSAQVPSLFNFSQDMAPLDVGINTIDSQHLIQYYEKNCRNWR